MFKKKCPVCGVKNSKERTVCIDCGAPFASGQIDERNDLCTALCAIGLDARVAERTLAERVWPKELGSEGSLGKIEIYGQPIRWVNVLKAEGGSEYYYSITYRKVYLVPDEAIMPYSPAFWKGYGTPAKGYGRSVRVRNVPLFGRVVHLRWRGYFVGDLIMRLGQDVSLNQALIRLKEDIKINCWPLYGCWTISPPSESNPLTAPSREQWNCYEIIARHMLESSGK